MRFVKLPSGFLSDAEQAQRRRYDHPTTGRLHSLRGDGAERALNGPSEVRLMKRLLNDHRAWPKRSNPYRIAADEHVGDEPGAEYFLDGRDTASIAQLHIDEH